MPNHQSMELLGNFIKETLTSILIYGCMINQDITNYDVMYE